MTVEVVDIRSHSKETEFVVLIPLKVRADSDTGVQRVQRLVADKFGLTDCEEVRVWRRKYQPLQKKWLGWDGDLLVGTDSESRQKSRINDDDFFSLFH